MLSTQKLTRKQQAFIDYYLDHPKASGTEAALATYNTNDPVVAASIAYENFRKPQIIASLVSYAELFESVIVGVVRDWGQSESPRKRELAVRNAQWMLDKIYGRATVKTEPQTSMTRISIDLTGSNSEPPQEFLDTLETEKLQSKALA